MRLVLPIAPSPELALVPLLLATGCQRPELVYETEHLRIGTAFDEPLCQGNLDHFELVIATAEAELATKLDRTVRLYLWAFDWTEVSGRWCRHDYAEGCYVGRSIYSSVGAVDHELVHMVANGAGNPALFWREGVAEAIQSNRTTFTNLAPLDNLDLKVPKLSYLVAGHFSRWLIETHGIESFRSLLAAPGDALEAFERVYDMSFEDAQAQYFAEAPYSYGALVACEHPDLAQIDATTWSETIRVDCANGDTYGGEAGIGTGRVMTVTERGFYELSTDSDLGVIGRCKDEDVALEPYEGDPLWGDLPPHTRTWTQQYVRSFPAGEPLVLELVPGRYELFVSYKEHGTLDAQLDVRAAPGPLPQVPEPSP